MSNKSRVALAAALLLSLSAWLYYRHATRTVARTLSGTVTAIDPDARRVTIRIQHPRTGQPLELTGHVPAECPIAIDGKPAHFGDLRVGDEARADGELTPSNQRIVATSVSVRRLAAPVAATAPSGGSRSAAETE